MLDSEKERSYFQELYHTYKDIMYYYAFQILGDAPSSEDAVHDAFLSAARNLNKIFEMNCNQSRNYLIIIVKNAALKIYHKRKREFASEEIFDEETTEDFSIEINTENKELQKNLFALIKSMDSKYSDVLVLRFYYHLQEKEIADTLDISVNNVKIRLYRAKAKLAGLIKKEGIL